MRTGTIDQSHMGCSRLLSALFGRRSAAAADGIRVSPNAKQGPLERNHSESLCLGPTAAQIAQHGGSQQSMGAVANHSRAAAIDYFVSVVLYWSCSWTYLEIRMRHPILFFCAVLAAVDDIPASLLRQAPPQMAKPGEPMRGAFALGMRRSKTATASIKVGASALWPEQCVQQRMGRVLHGPSLSIAP